MSESSCLIIAGEKSGEEHAMTFLPRLKVLNPDLQFFGVGGDDMEKMGVKLFYHFKDFSSMGFSSVIGKIPFYLKASNQLLDEVKKRKTKFAILVDYQDFNLRIAKKLAKLDVEIFYYVAPQAWGWRPGRAQVLSKIVNTLFCILPFEKPWFLERGVKQAKSVNHPVYLRFKKQLQLEPLKKWDDRKIKDPRLLLLPGSRGSEIKAHLPIMRIAVLKLKSIYPTLEVGLVKVDHLNQQSYEYISDLIDTEWSDRDLESGLVWGDICFASSGTVTLTCGLFAIPTVVVYQSSLFNEFILYQLIKYRGYVSLTNLILGEKILPEWIQGQFTPEILQYEFKRIMQEKVYNEMIQKLASVRHLLMGEIQDVGEYIHLEMKKR